MLKLVSRGVVLSALEGVGGTAVVMFGCRQESDVYVPPGQGVELSGLRGEGHLGQFGERRLHRARVVGLGTKVMFPLASKVVRFHGPSTTCHIGLVAYVESALCRSSPGCSGCSPPAPTSSRTPRCMRCPSSRRWSGATTRTGGCVQGGDVPGDRHRCDLRQLVIGEPVSLTLAVRLNVTGRAVDRDAGEVVRHVARRIAGEPGLLGVHHVHPEHDVSGGDGLAVAPLVAASRSP